MEFQTLLLQREAHVARITLNRPEVANALNETVISELAAAFAAMDADPDVHVIVLSGAGRFFCAGADANWMRKMADYTPEQNRADAQGLADMLNRIDSCRKPVVAQVNGDAMGGGVGLVAVCDIVVAEEQARFALSEVKLGLIPATISPYVIRALGMQQARCLFITGERFAAPRARELGLAHRVCATGESAAAVQALLAELSANGPQAMQQAKRLVRDIGGKTISAELIADTAQRIADIRATPEAKEGLSAFLAKRKPAWVEPQQ